LTDPIIGVTTYRLRNSSGLGVQGANEAYIQALVQAGGLPVMLPVNLDEVRLVRLSNHLDGILFTGGGDILPERYGSTPHPKVTHVDETRDQVEIELLVHAVEKAIPFLGICRGLQVINVASGGTLYEDLLDQRPDTLEHDYDQNYPRNYLAHSVEIGEKSRLAQILGMRTVRVNSLHHQGIRQLAPGLLPSAYAPDGLIEALELPDHPFGMAVQWHPEWLLEQAGMRNLFREFIEAASNGR
jgi:putative glutamine amidotransferase